MVCTCSCDLIPDVNTGKVVWVKPAICYAKRERPIETLGAGVKFDAQSSQTTLACPKLHAVTEEMRMRRASIGILCSPSNLLNLRFSRITVMMTQIEHKTKN